MEEIKLVQLKEAQHNARRTFDEAKLKELAASIKEKGVLQAIIVRPSNGKYEIVCGSRRFRAAVIAGLSSIPVIIKDYDDKQALECQVIENLQREDIHPLEEAEGYEVLMKKHGHKSADDIAAKIGKSKAYVYERLKLCELIPENRKLFYEGKFSPSTALLVARVPAHLQKEAGSKVAHGKYRGDEPMSFRIAKEYIHKHFMLQLKEAQFDTKEKGLAGKSSCIECNKRTGTQKELFKDVSSADVCTDPGCFEAKKNAHTQRAIAKFKEQGKEVVSQDEAKKLFKYENDESPDNKFINIDKEHYYRGQYLKLRPIVKSCKDIKTTFAVQPFSGKIIEMINNTDLPKIFKKAGIKDRDSSGSSGANAAVERRKERVRKATVGKICAAIVEKVNADNKLSFLRLFAEAVLNEACFDAQRMFIQRRNPAIKGDAIRIEVKKIFLALKDEELFGFCFEILILNHAWSTWGSQYGPITPKVCKHYKIDTAKLRAQVEAEFKAKKQKKPVKKELTK
jgi:ParB/RepB/Spo0J family partition protein